MLWTKKEEIYRSLQIAGEDRNPHLGSHHFTLFLTFSIPKSEIENFRKKSFQKKQGSVDCASFRRRRRVFSRGTPWITKLYWAVCKHFWIFREFTDYFFQTDVSNLAFFVDFWVIFDRKKWVFVPSERFWGSETALETISGRFWSILAPQTL